MSTMSVPLPGVPTDATVTPFSDDADEPHANHEHDVRVGNDAYERIHGALLIGANVALMYVTHMWWGTYERVTSHIPYVADMGNTGNASLAR